MANFEKVIAKNEKKETNKKKKKHLIKWGTYCFSWWALPLMLIIIPIDKIEAWQYKRLKWSDDIANKVLDKILAYNVEKLSDEKYGYLVNYPTGLNRKKVPLRYKKWVDKFSYNLQDYIEDVYEMPNFIKTVDATTWQKWVIFTKVKKRVDKNPLP